MLLTLYPIQAQILKLESFFFFFRSEPFITFHFFSKGNSLLHLLAKVTYKENHNTF